MRFLLIICFSLFVFSWVKAQSDTLNRTGADGKKYGYWIIYGKDRPKSGFADTSIIEEGKYYVGKKAGIWKTYYANRIKKSEIEYKNNRPNGLFMTFYDNGKIEEEGNWRGTFYVGEFKQYYENGFLRQQKNYGVSGKIVGWQFYYMQNGELERKYYYENGIEITDSSQKDWNIRYEENGFQENDPEKFCRCKIKDMNNPMIEFDKETGDSTYFFLIGYYKIKLMGKFSKKRLESGKCFIGMKGNIYSKPQEYDVIGKKVVKYVKPKTVLETLPDGYNKIFNENRMIEYDGEFKNGKLWTGKKYIYDSNGLLDKIELYKEGKLAGDK